MVTQRHTEAGTISESSRELSWRLVHDGVRVHDLFESEGVTGTKFNLFTGTEEECRAEIARLGLAPLPEPASD